MKQNESRQGVNETVVLENDSVYASLCSKINLTPVAEARPLEAFRDNDMLSEASADERIARGMSAFLDLIAQSSQPVERLDKSLLDFHIGQLDRQISRQLDAVMHTPAFQALEGRWRGLKLLVARTDFRKNAKIEVLDVSKEALQRDFEDTPELIQSGLYRLTYIEEYDTPGGQPISAMISDFEFTNSPMDVALLRNISKVAAAAHMPFIGSVGAAFFGKQSMEEVAAIQDIGNYFDRAEYIKWKSFRETDDARYVGLTMPRVLGRLPYGKDTTPVRAFNYEEAVKGPDHDRYLWVNASFAFAANMVRSFVNNGWCVQIRGPQAGGKVEDLPVHLYDLGTGVQPKIPTEVLIPETREFEFANLGFIPLSFYKNHDFACFFSASSTQKPALYETKEATANSRINARLPYIFLLSRIAHYLKLIQRENIGTTKDRRLLELELNNWIKGLVTEMKDPDDELQASHPLRDAKVTVEDIDDNQLTRVSTMLFPSGDAHLRYELRPEPTPGITDMKFVLSGRELRYFNQKQEWTPFEWPGQSLENLSHIEWQTEQGGLRTALDSQGRFGLIRLLERAKVSQQDSARYLLTWTPDTSLGLPLRVQLRSEVGSGPLEVLELRHYTLPARIFVTGATKAEPTPSAIGPPPLPPAAISAAKHAAVPLPDGASGPLPEVE